MKASYSLIIFIISFIKIYAQPNCEAFLYHYKDTLKYEACKKSEQIEGLYQFSKEYQTILDESIKIDSTFAYAYRKKSTAYLKSGDFITWKQLMDKAVKYDPEGNLEYRGLMRFKCFRDYNGALSDFQKLESLGVQPDHLSITKSLCYYSKGEIEKATEILENQLKIHDDLGLIGYLHLGVFYLEQKNYRKAIHCFYKQIEVNEIAESHFYLALSLMNLQLSEEYFSHLEEAKNLYIQGMRMSDVYIDPIHKIYLEDIEDELRTNFNDNNARS